MDKEIILIIVILIIIIGIFIGVGSFIYQPQQKPEQPTETEFCGTSTNGQCSSDVDCMIGGCSGQVCQSKSEEPIITTCEYTDCYNPQPYGLTCGCKADKCQWE